MPDKNRTLLRTECNTPETGEAAYQAFIASDHVGKHEATTVFEHGQWWVVCPCGAAWSVVDAEGGPAIDGFDFEQVSHGDEEYHEED